MRRRPRARDRLAHARTLVLRRSGCCTSAGPLHRWPSLSPTDLPNSIGTDGIGAGRGIRTDILGNMPGSRGSSTQAHTNAHLRRQQPRLPGGEHPVIRRSALRVRREPPGLDRRRPFRRLCRRGGYRSREHGSSEARGRGRLEHAKLQGRRTFLFHSSARPEDARRRPSLHQIRKFITHGRRRGSQRLAQPVTKHNTLKSA